nr:sensor domain-containing diguanylate cyclase [Kofleriaceae bacterium]
MRAGQVYTVALAIVGWGLVLALPAVGAVADLPTSAATLALFVAVIVAARATAFRLAAGGAVVSLDSAYYVAAVLCVGTANGGRLVALALSIDAVVRLAVQWRRGRLDRERLPGELVYAAYFGGLSGGLLVACGWIYGGDGLVGAELEAVAVSIRVVAIAATLLVTHYAAQGARLVLLGHTTWRAYVVDVVPKIGAEASLVPIGIVLVLLYDPDQPLGFALLSITYLLIDFMFARLSRTREQLRERVRDLEILNDSARRLSAALQLEELVEAIARETCRAVPDAEIVALVHRRAGETGLVLDGFDRTTEQHFRRELSEGVGAAGWVMKQGVSRRIDDLPGSDVGMHAGASGIKSWLGVPLMMYGACDGVIAVQSSHGAAFRAHDQRLLESLAHQIAAALQNANLYELAMVDGLTGLFVRRYFDARIQEEIERSKRYEQPFSVVMMDVDDFKKLNDTYGHLVGDRVLRAIATVVKAQMRGVDTAARYGGEEIAVVLPRTEMVGAYNQAERIRAAIAEMRITTDDEPPKVLQVTASLGIAAYPESKARDGTDLVRRADRALYRAKKTGKNRVELFWSDDSSPVRIPTIDPEAGTSEASEAGEAGEAGETGDSGVSDNRGASDD